MKEFLAGAALGAAVTAAIGWWKLRQRTKMLGRFFSFAAHELNTPITAVNMTIINLLSGVFGEVPREQTPWMEMMREQVTRLNGMVGEMRDLIHMQIHGDLRLTIEDAEVAELMQEAAGNVKRGMDQASITVKTTVDEGLPTVRVDRDRAVRTLSSMLFHARKFRSGGPIELAARVQPERACIEVTYVGPALSVEEAERSLDLFYPARKRRDLVLGATGLGLGLLRQIMRRQGGDFELKLGAAGSTTLALSLPARKLAQPS
jgi:signal transduction histidine kinase